MKDIIAKYRKRTFFQNSAIVVTSLALALGVHMYALDGELGNYLKSSVLDINGIEQTADIYGKVSPERDHIILGVQKPMNEVTNIAFSLLFDHTNVEVSNIQGTIPATEIVSLANEPGVVTVLVTFDSPQTLSGESDFLTLDVIKQNPSTAYLNILNANFKDIDQKEYLLSTSGILF